MRIFQNIEELQSENGFSGYIKKQILQQVLTS
jgi:hypothetical protein